MAIKCSAQMPEEPGMDEPPVWKALRHTTQEERATKHVSAGCEMSRMIEGVVTDRAVGRSTVGAHMGGRHHAEFDALLPHRVVVVFAVERQVVDIARARTAGHWAPLMTGNCDRIHAERVDGESHLLERRFRRVHRN